jgi:protein tyrosine phosphatase (PTP) superfamily phosphohydrolase (DUF442 family)
MPGLRCFRASHPSNIAQESASNTDIHFPYSMTSWRRWLQLPVVFTALTLAPTLGAQSPQTKSGKHTVGKHLTVEGLPNFGEVTPQLYRGGEPTPEGFQRLAQMGVGIVVDFGTSSRDQEEIEALGMKYVTIPWHCPFPRDEWFAKFLKLIQENPNKKIFAHCRLGDDRTGMMIAAYRMGFEGWNADEAMNEMRQFGFTGAHHFICAGLAPYERRFPDKLKNSPAFEGLRLPQ